MKMNEQIEQSEKYLIHSYNRYPIVLDHGEGVYLYDTDGKKYLDFGGGIAVCALGYSNDAFKNALKKQIDKGIHFSNYFYSEPLLSASRGLTEATGMDKVFMANSGTEANEGALKLARKYAIMKGHENRHEIVSMNKAFHGRSMGALSVTGTAKYREPFEPMIGGVSFANYNDLNSVKKAVTENTYAIIVEAIQGEGGIYPADDEFLKGIRDICTEHDIMMICDEIQCGMGRSGKMFAYQQYGIRPDIVTMAKGIGNGITVGAIATTEEIAKALVPGDHGTTFGGNPLACTAVAATLSEFARKKIPSHVTETGEYLKQRLNEVAAEKEIAKEVRGMGLMCGLELTKPAGTYIQKALDLGVIFMSAGTHVIRFVPPLIIEKEHVDEMIDVLKAVL
jgi:acetylornithine/N-succinyldiaminopimelate aminotransferase